MRKKVTPFVESIAESTAACLITMVQGNIFALGLGHWLLASHTGLFAGSAAATVIVVSRTSNRWIISGVLGLATAVVDFFVHPGMFGPIAMEAIVTGIGAAVLSFLVGSAIRTYRARRAAAG